MNENPGPQLYESPKMPDIGMTNSYDSKLSIPLSLINVNLSQVDILEIRISDANS